VEALGFSPASLGIPFSIRAFQARRPRPGAKARLFAGPGMARLKSCPFNIYPCDHPTAASYHGDPTEKRRRPGWDRRTSAP
jgi:hypothetical protein